MTFHGYAIAVRYDPNDGAFVVWCPDLDGCMAHDYTLVDAMRVLAEVQDQWLAMKRAGGYEIPPAKFGDDKLDNYRWI